MKLLYVKHLLSLRRLHITSVTTLLFYFVPPSLPLFISPSLSILSPFICFLLSVTLLVVSSSPQTLFSSVPLFSVMFCHLSRLRTGVVNGSLN